MTRVFTPAQANALIPRLRPLLAALRDAHHAFVFAREQLQELEAFGEAETEEAGRFRAEAAEHGRQAERLATEVHELGAELKDPILGLVDFYARRADGSIVELCYRDDEDRITHWHPPGAGYAGRRPLAEL